MPRKIVSKSPISNPEALKIMQDREDSQEMSYLQKSALEQFFQCSRVDVKDVPKISKKLIKDYNITEKGAIFLINSMPKLVEEMEMLLQGEVLDELIDEDYEKILEFLNQFRLTTIDD